MNPALLESQFDALEEPQRELVLDASRPPVALAEQIRRAFGL